MDRVRYRADDPGKYKLYFELLHQKLAEYNIDSRYIYNIDEKGFMIRAQKKAKHVFSRDQWERKQVRQAL